MKELCKFNAINRDTAGHCAAADAANSKRMSHNLAGTLDDFAGTFSSAHTHVLCAFTNILCAGRGVECCQIPCTFRRIACASSCAFAGIAHTAAIFTCCAFTVVLCGCRLVLGSCGLRLDARCTK